MGYRKERLEELIRRVVSELLLREIKDPRIGFVTITDVSLSKDYSVARIGISVLNEEKDLNKTLQGLESARGFIQKQVGREIRMRTIPKIVFYFDKSLKDGVDMINLLDTLEKSRPEPEDDGSDHEKE